MKIHEHQAKELFSEAGIPVPTGKVAFTVDEARSAAQELFNKGNSLVVVKAQIHAGGRGKAGGVKLARSVDEAAQCAREILGKKLITPQTSAEGQEVRRLWVEAGSQIEKEFYLSAIVDRKSQSISVLASAEGGMDIEELAHKHPERSSIFRWIQSVVLNFSMEENSPSF